MALDTAFAELMVQTVTTYPVTARDMYGKRTFGAGVDWACHLQFRMHRVRAGNGQEVQADGTAYVYGVVTGVSVDDIITVNGESTQVLYLVTRYDEDGPHHSEIHFGSAGAAGIAGTP